VHGASIGGGGGSHRADAESNRRFRCKVAVWCISTLFQSEPEKVGAFAIDRLLDVASAAQHSSGGGEQLRTMAEESVLRHLLQACCALAAPRDDDDGGGDDDEDDDDDDDDDDGCGPPGSGSGSRRRHVRCGYRHRWDGRKVSELRLPDPELTERTLRLHICRRREGPQRVQPCSLSGEGRPCLRSVSTHATTGVSPCNIRYRVCVCVCACPDPAPLVARRRCCASLPASTRPILRGESTDCGAPPAPPPLRFPSLRSIIQQPR
jgi:hypothetical protein